MIYLDKYKWANIYIYIYGQNICTRVSRGTRKQTDNLYRHIKLNREAKPRKWNLEGLQARQTGFGIRLKTSFNRKLPALSTQWPAPSTRVKPWKQHLEGLKLSKCVPVHFWMQTWIGNDQRQARDTNLEKGAWKGHARQMGFGTLLKTSFNRKTK